MKEVKLKADKPFHNSVDVAVIDFTEKGERQRCKITVEFAQSDVRLLQRQGMDFGAAMDYYKKWIYEVVKVHLAQDWSCISGWEEVMAIVEEKVKAYY